MNKNSRRHKEHARRREAGGYVALPHAVIRSQEWADLSPFAVKLLLDMLSQYRGDNNGDLSAYWSKMHRDRGWKSKDTLFKSLAELRNGNWLELTRLGKRNKTPSLYAVTFYAVDYCGGKLEVAATGSPSGAWRRPVAARPIALRLEPTAPAATDPESTAASAKVVQVRYKRPARSRVRQTDLSEENRSGRRTCEVGDLANRSASRTYSGHSADVTGTPTVPLSRFTTTTGVEPQREERESPSEPAPTEPRFSPDTQALIDRAQQRKEERLARLGPPLPRPQRKPHLLDPRWSQGLERCAKGTGYGPSHQNAFLGVKVKKFGWERVAGALRECENKGLFGDAARDLISERCR